jgi:hypothetical protein
MVDKNIDYILNGGFSGDLEAIQSRFEYIADFAITYVTRALKALTQDLEQLGTFLSDVLSELETGEEAPSPLVIDLDGDGIELTSVDGSSATYWDHDLDGFAERSGWVSSDDGILAIDLNDDGTINDSSELDTRINLAR